MTKLEMDLVGVEALLKVQGQRLEGIEHELKILNNTLIKNTAQLSEHMRRTELMERRFEPVEDHVKFIQKLLKLFITMATIPSAIYFLIRLLGKG